MGNPSFGKETVERVGRAYRDEKLEPLPEAEKEVKTLGQLYGASKSEVYVGSEAREDRFKAEAGQAKILHLATHGFLNDANPMYSAVVLASGDSGLEDGLLETWEIMKMDLKADLVVLSACETARGHIGPGEGVIGLSWALFVAGAPTTVVSQWKVESQSTTALMTAFHRVRKTDVMHHTSFATGRALRDAELELIHSTQYSHPFYWAPFVVIGDPN
jgi:CHAT domain-containing protein